MRSCQQEVRGQRKTEPVTCSRCEQWSYQVVVGEPGDLLLDAVLHFGLRGQRRSVVEDLLLLLNVILQQFDLRVEGLQLIPVLPGLGLQLGFQQPDRTGPAEIASEPVEAASETYYERAPAA